MDPIFEDLIEESIHQIHKAIKCISRLFTSRTRATSTSTSNRQDLSGGGKANNITNLDREAEPVPVTGCTYKLSGQLSQAVAAEYHLSLDESKAREGQYQSRHELEVEQADFHARQFTGKPMPGEKVANRLPNREAESRRGMGVNF